MCYVVILQKYFYKTMAYFFQYLQCHVTDWLQTNAELYN